MRKNRGFTLIELLIVVAIIGIIAAIAIPNLLNAINKGRQKRTMADMRTVATALGEYGTDNQWYVANANINSVYDYLNPWYVQTDLILDGWNNRFYLGSDATGTNYSLWSYGRDKTAQAFAGGFTQDFDADIIHSGGVFIQRPEGTQK